MTSQTNQVAKTAAANAYACGEFNNAILLHSRDRAWWLNHAIEARLTVKTLDDTRNSIPVEKIPAFEEAYAFFVKSQTDSIKKALYHGLALHYLYQQRQCDLMRLRFSPHNLG